MYKIGDQIRAYIVDKNTEIWNVGLLLHKIFYGSKLYLKTDLMSSALSANLVLFLYGTWRK